MDVYALNLMLEKILVACFQGWYGYESSIWEKMVYEKSNSFDFDNLLLKYMYN